MSTANRQQGQITTRGDLLPFRFEPPAMPAHTLVRERLLQHLEQAMQQRLILLQAPAGSGKTLLLSQWRQAQRLPCSWLNLQDFPDHPDALLHGLILSLRQLPGIPRDLGQSLLEQHPLHAGPADHSPEYPLAQLLKEVQPHLKGHAHLLLDAAEHLQHPGHWQWLSLLLHALPNNLTLVISSRAPLPLSLSRLQLTDQLLKLDGQALAFTPDEIRQLFRQLNKAINNPWVTDLWQQTQGWPALVRLISQNGNAADARLFLQEHVLQNLTQQERQLLGWMCGLQAAHARLLVRLTQQDFATTLEKLARNGLLQVATPDATDPWYRLHPFLQQEMRQQLASSLPADSINPDFHARAARALADLGLFDAAADQAFKAADPVPLASYMAQLTPWLLKHQDPGPFLQWKTALGRSQIQASIPLTLTCGWALLLAGQTHLLPDLLAPLLATQNPQARLLQAMHLASQGKIEPALQQALAVYPLLHDACLEVRIQALLLLSRIHSSQNRLKAARGFNREAQMLAHQARSPELEQLLACDQACLEMNKGHLQLAEHLLHQALQLPGQASLPKGRLLLLQGYLHWCQGYNDLAEQQLDESLALLKPASDPYLISGLLVLSLVARGKGNLTAAFDWLGEAERTLHIQHPASASWQPMITALKANLWLDQGKLDLALAWLQQLVQQDVEQPLIQLPLQNQLLHLLYSRALLSHRRYTQAMELLQARLEDTRAYPVAGLFIQVHKALALKYTRQTRDAQLCLKEALQLAQPEGFRMPFLVADTGLLALLEDLLEQLATGSELQTFAQQLLEQARLRHSQHRSLDPTHPVETLSSREEKVLLLVAEGLANKEIAERLFISLHTVKTHLRHILRKLDVRSRTQAVSRARELRLV